MVADTVVRQSIVVKEPINMIEPKAFSAACDVRPSNAQYVAFTEISRAIGNLLGLRAEMGRHQFREPLEEEAAVDQNGDASDSHMHASVRQSAPRFLDGSG